MSLVIVMRKITMIFRDLLYDSFKSFTLLGFGSKK